MRREKMGDEVFLQPGGWETPEQRWDTRWVGASPWSGDGGPLPFLGREGKGWGWPADI